ncbi:hypothetical protein MD484_g7427, partial [Candolleomyces efflorescens]
MSSAPPVPPRPAEWGPPPPDYREDSYYEPDIVSPRPHRTDNPAADLNELMPATPSVSVSMPAPFSGPISAPAYGPGAGWSPWAIGGNSSPYPQPPPAPPTPAMPPSRPTPSPSPSNSLTAALPSIPTLLQALPSITSPGHDPSLKIAWARDVCFLADRAHHLHLQLTTPVGQPVPSVSDPIIGPMPLSALDASIGQLATAAVPLVLSLSAAFPAGQPYQQTLRTGSMGPWQAEAVYLRAVMASTGAHPRHIEFNPKVAFRDFETAARGGYAGAWFRLGRDYETFGDFKHARECFERGAKLGVEACLYRIGMAHLLGQLGLTADVATALPILHRAAVLASLECPQPAYVYSLLLLSEFSSVPPIPAQTFASLSALAAYPQPPLHPSIPLQPLIPLGSSPHLESRHHLERAAYLNYGPAQYKLGHAFEFADPPFYFDPLLSVQYYSLASQNGEVEADMALSKWFLCGSTPASNPTSGGKPEGGFEKDESLALTFAQKASSRGLPSAHFAMGYYAEVGVGRPSSIPDAVHYYTLASQSGNTDATSRLEALTRNPHTPTVLEKGVHEQRLERSRTMAQRRMEEEPMSPPFEGQTFGSMAMGAQAAQQQQLQQQPLPASAGGGGGLRPPTGGRLAQLRDPRAVVEQVRKNSMYQPLQGAVSSPVPGGGIPPLPRPITTIQPPTPQSSGYQQQQQRPQSSGGGGRRPHSASPAGGFTTNTNPTTTNRPYSTYGTNPNASNPRIDSPHHSMYGSPHHHQPHSAGVSGGFGGAPLAGANLGGGGKGGGRSPSPGRKTSPGPGRMGKLSVGVDGNGIPPVPALPAGTGTPNVNVINAGHTPKPSGKHPATFAEMGIQGAKAEDKDCVVM